MGLVAPRNVGSSRSRERIHVSCIGRLILYHWPIREDQKGSLILLKIQTTSIVGAVTLGSKKDNNKPKHNMLWLQVLLIGKKFFFTITKENCSLFRKWRTSNSCLVGRNPCPGDRQTQKTGKESSDGVQEESCCSSLWRAVMLAQLYSQREVV